MKPQDILILLKIISKKDLVWRQMDLAHELQISPSEVATALERARKSKLIDPSKRKIFKSALIEFISHGLQYVYPVTPGPIVRGTPTAHSAEPLSGFLLSSSELDTYVWPDAEGKTKGQAIDPLYPSVPHAVKKDPNLHELLALVDAIRVGRARERNIAVAEIEKRIR